LTLAFNVAALVVIDVAAWVVADGALVEVVKVKSFPRLVPVLLLATMRK
jgi:hypothetical protein